MKLTYRLFTLLITTFFANCKQESTVAPNVDSLFAGVPLIQNVHPIINEVSGITDSETYSGHLWAQEDGGNSNAIHLINYNGDRERMVYLKGVTNRDWEDMQLVNNQIYLGEIGDNNAVHADYAIYKFAEPSSTVDTVSSIESIRYTYPDGSHDAEAFLVEPSTGVIYIITKRDNPSRIYKLSPPFVAGMLHKALLVGSLPYTGTVSAALSSDGTEIIVKTYFELGYYKRSTGETIEAALQRQPAKIPYEAEPQGEAVCFNADNSGYFTLSEKGGAADVQLYFYKRN